MLAFCYGREVLWKIFGIYKGTLLFSSIGNELQGMDRLIIVSERVYRGSVRSSDRMWISWSTTGEVEYTLSV